MPVEDDDPERNDAEESFSPEAMADLVLGSLDFDARSHPFGGYSVGGSTPEGDQAPLNAHLLVSGPTGSGKSRRVLAPAALKHDGPVVMVSSKPDLIDLVAAERISVGGAGRTYVLDLGGSIRPEKLPEGASKIYLDPCALIASDDQALDLANIMVLAANGEHSSDPFWGRGTVPFVAAVLRAAGTDGIAWAAAAMSNTKAPRSPSNEVKYRVRSGDFGDPDGLVFDEELYEKACNAALRRQDTALWSSDITDALPMFEPSSPSWFNAAARLQLLGSYEMAARLRSQLFSDADKMTASFAGLAANAVSPWLRQAIRPPEGATLLKPETMTHSRATLFVVAPADGVGAPAAIMTLDMLASRWRDNQTEDVRLPKLLFVIDEMMNTAPWEKLPTVVTEARGMGIYLVGAVQTTAQFAKRFGSAGMDELRRIFPSILLLVGATEVELMSELGDRRKMFREHNDVDIPRPRLPVRKSEGLLIHSAPPTDDEAAYFEYQGGVPVALKDVSSLERSLKERCAALLYDYRRSTDVVPDVGALFGRHKSVLQAVEDREVRYKAALPVNDRIESVLSEVASLDGELDSTENKNGGTNG